MQISQRLKLLIDSDRTVFRPIDLRLLWRESALSAKVNAVRMVKNSLLIRLAKGYYVLNDKFNPYELANRIVSPSYVSFQTALKYAGVSFQERGEISSVATLDYRKKVRGIIYSYVAMKKALFFNFEGVVVREGAPIALPERAILDSFYFGFLPDIDTPEKINKQYLVKLSKMYPQTVQKKCAKLL